MGCEKMIHLMASNSLATPLLMVKWLKNNGNSDWVVTHS